MRVVAGVVTILAICVFSACDTPLIVVQPERTAKCSTHPFPGDDSRAVPWKQGQHNFDFRHEEAPKREPWGEGRERVTETTLERAEYCACYKKCVVEVLDATEHYETNGERELNSSGYYDSLNAPDQISCHCEDE